MYSQLLTAEALPRTLVLPLTEYRLWKRIIDVLGSVVLLAFLFPLMLIVVALIKLSSRGPVIYTQLRLTQGGKVFPIYKFRTMVVDAEAKTGAVWAEKNDERVTKLGRFLRRTRIDELPQLFNVLAGEMSLVGPRPERPELAVELAKTYPRFYRRLEVPAGITGYSQVQRGYASCLQSYRSKLIWDIAYVNHMSFALDMKIAFKTVWVVLSGRGAR